MIRWLLCKIGFHDWVEKGYDNYYWQRPWWGYIWSGGYLKSPYKFICKHCGKEK